MQFTSVSSAGGNVILSGANGTPGGNYVLLSTADLALPLSSWTRVITNQFDPSGNFSVTQPLGAGSSKAFYRLLIP